MKKIKCTACNGTGYYNAFPLMHCQCMLCDGTGKVNDWSNPWPIRKLTAALMLVIVMSGCYQKAPSKVDTVHSEYETIVIDGCQYLRYKDWNNSTLTHKGNCNNPIHKTK